MGGRIWVDSQLGAGSTFHFTAKLNNADEMLQPAAPAPSADGFPVLALADHPTSRRTLVEMLRQGGHLPIFEEDLDAARARVADGAQGAAFQAIVFNVPEGALELCHQITEDPAFAGISVIAILEQGERGDAVDLGVSKVSGHR